MLCDNKLLCFLIVILHKHLTYHSVCLLTEGMLRRLQISIIFNKIHWWTIVVLVDNQAVYTKVYPPTQNL